MTSTLLPEVVDRYNGVTVNSLNIICDLAEFPHLLTSSLDKWSKENRRCIWFNINIKHAGLVPHLAKEGFNFHHASENYLMMYKWLPVDIKPHLPPACHTNLGVGGMVFNDDNEILVVSENSLDYPHWKLPGGYVEKGEDIQDAAVREVKEETGIDSVFDSMITLRHTHNVAFGNSDIYVIVLLKALTSKITKCDHEIRESRWMNLEEYLTHPHVHEFNRFIVRQFLDLKKKNLRLTLQKQLVNTSNWSREITALILEDKHCEKSSI